jgi:hypothetical protein
MVVKPYMTSGSYTVGRSYDRNQLYLAQMALIVFQGRAQQALARIELDFISVEPALLR